MLAIPAGATITYARLYWSAAGTSAAADTSVLLDRAGTGAFSATVTADASATAATTGADAHNYYQSTADVTALVVANGAGAYRVGGVDALPIVGINDETRFAAWWMVVFYRLASDPPRNLAIFDGFDYIEAHTPAGQRDGVGFPGADVRSRRQGRGDRVHGRRARQRRLAVVERIGRLRRDQSGEQLLQQHALVPGRGGLERRRSAAA